MMGIETILAGMMGMSPAEMREQLTAMLSTAAKASETLARIEAKIDAMEAKGNGGQ